MGTGAAYLLIMARSLPSWSSTTWLRDDEDMVARCVDFEDWGGQSGGGVGWGDDDDARRGRVVGEGEGG